MKAEYDYKFAKFVLILIMLTFIFLTTIWLILQSHPISLDAIADLKGGIIKFSCEFARDIGD